MAKDQKILEFLEARATTIENLEAIRFNLSRCIENGLVNDPDATYYNEVISLIDEASSTNHWDELSEIIAKAKVLEVDVAVWLAGFGQTSISLPWPHKSI